jgi:hypothetical protein
MLMEYRMEIEKSNKVEELSRLPDAPFVVVNKEQNRHYIVSEYKNGYMLTRIESGKSYNYENYTENSILDIINKGAWKLLKSKIVIE